MCTPMSMMPSAAQVSLRTDRDYIALLDAQSSWPTQYHFARINPTAPSAFPIQGLNAPHMGPAQIPQYNKLLATNFRIDVRSSQNRLQTELFGRSPYIALGRGILNHVDTNTALLHGNPIYERGNRVLVERPWDRSQFVTVPAELKNLPVDTRKGRMTRMNPQYLQPRDD